MSHEVLVDFDDLAHRGLALMLLMVAVRLAQAAGGRSRNWGKLEWQMVG